MPAFTVYIGHVHPVIFLCDSWDHVRKHDAGLANKERRENCSACGEPCHDLPVICCLSYDFTIHWLCSPMPWALERDSHLCNFILKDFHEANCDDEYWYCDSCKEASDKKAPVYYNKEPDYCTEIRCMMLEVSTS